jgi:hypothetical protein
MRLITLAAAASIAAGALASTAQATTLDRTLHAHGSGPTPHMSVLAGEGHLVRVAPGMRPSASRHARRRSLAYFAHLTDLHIADEGSPARHEQLHRVTRAYGGFWRPQEAFGPHVVDQTVRAVNRQPVSPLASVGGPAPLGFALVTGDMADNAQANEVRWAVRTLDGGRVDPFSGRRVSARNPCRAPRSVVRRLNRSVRARRFP